MLRLSAPVYCYLELTPACNSRCPGCSNVFLEDKQGRGGPLGLPPLDFGGWHTVINKLRPHVHRLRLTGGECTLYPHFANIVRFIDQLGIDFVIFSNGRWKEPEHLITFLQTLPHFQGFLISLHGTNDEAHAAFCGVTDTFRETTENVQRATQAGLSVNTSTVITQQNYDKIGEIVKLSISLGANYVIFNRYVGKPVDGITATPVQLKEAVGQIDALIEAGAQVKHSVCIPQCFMPNASHGCLAGIAFWTVDPYGNVRPCNHAPFVCGNLRWQSVEEIVQGEKMGYWHRLIPDQCSHCSVFSKCHGGCRAQAMLLGQEKDDLMGIPIFERAETPPQELVFYEEAHIASRFKLRQEEFGYLLIRDNHVVPVSSRAKEILEVLDGQTTLRQVRDQFGQEALDFVGSLYNQGLVVLGQSD